MRIGCPQFSRLKDVAVTNLLTLSPVLKNKDCSQGQPVPAQFHSSFIADTIVQLFVPEHFLTNVYILSYFQSLFKFLSTEQILV